MSIKRNTKKKATSKSVGHNIKFSTRAYKQIVAYTKENGYKLGAFCEMAVLDKIAKEALSKI